MNVANQPKIKSIFCSSAEEMLCQLKRLVSQEPAWIMVPNEHFRTTLLKEASWALPKGQGIYTPASLLHHWGVRSIGEEGAAWDGRYTGWEDPVLYAPNTLVAHPLGDWIRRHCANWTFKDWAPSPKCLCILLGPFSKEALKQLTSMLSDWVQQFIYIERTCKGNGPSELLSAEPLASEPMGYAWMSKDWEPGEYGIVCAQQTAIVDTSPLFRNPLSPLQNAWLDWQEQGSVAYFRAYLYRWGIHSKAADREQYIRDVDEIRQAGWVERFSDLRAELLKQSKDWIRKFGWIESPLKAPIATFVSLYREELQQQCELPLDSIWDSCPIEVNRRQFFAYIRRRLGVKNGYRNSISLEEALYVPIKKCRVLVRTSEIPPAILSGLVEIQRRGGDVHIGLITDGAPATPPLKLTRSFTYTCTGPQWLMPKSLRIPPNWVHFSCKNWEQFRRDPLPTWLSASLKSHSVPFRDSGEKKLFGEWVHACLNFHKAPQDLKDWETQIQERLDGLLTGKAHRLWIQQMGQRVLQGCRLMAKACEALSDGSWELFSEQVLPSTGPYMGRIDLLALNRQQQQAVVVDYKTGLQAKLDPKSLGEGQGWQLILYGEAIRAQYPTYAIQLWMVKPNGETMKIQTADATPQRDTIRNWIEDFKATGNYDPLPAFDRRQVNRLPLVYGPAALS